MPPPVRPRRACRPENLEFFDQEDVEEIIEIDRVSGSSATSATSTIQEEDPDFLSRYSNSRPLPFSVFPSSGSQLSVFLP